MQNPGRAIEFAPAEGFAFGLRDINNLSIRKAICAIWRWSDRPFFRVAGSAGIDTGRPQEAKEQPEQ